MERPARNPSDELTQSGEFEGNDQSDMALRNVSKEDQEYLRELIPPDSSSEIDATGLQDRRCFPRARVAATAIALVGGRYVGAYVVRNLSAGGADMLGDNNLAIGQVVQILLRVGKQFSQSIAAEVVRRKQLPSGEQSFAVAFGNLAPDIEDSLQNLAVFALESGVAKKRASVLVLDSPPSVLSALESDVGSLGHELMAVATPLDAISLLSGDTHRIVAVVVGCDLDGADSLGFLNFLKDGYPHIRRVVALPGGSQPTQLERAIASGAVEAVLVEPWDSDLLSKVLRQ
jgi:CheY-like chemotaxis protein